MCCYADVVGALFFFFKQKTAYEMRISDWSSDVCSSDLGTRHGSRHLREALIEAARAAARTKGTFLSARYSRLVRRRGPNKAAVATAHSILIAVHHMLRTGEVYRDLGAEFYDKRTDPDRNTRPHIAELEAAGSDRNSTRLNSSH